MGQAEIIRILEGSKVPLSRSEIARALDVEEFKVSKLLNTLLRYSEVEVIELPKELAMKFYKCKRRLKLYYV